MVFEEDLVCHAEDDGGEGDDWDDDDDSEGGDEDNDFDYPENN